MATAGPIADQIIDHAAKLRNAAAAAVEDEKRNQPRQPYVAAVPLVLLSSDGKPMEPITAKTLDISQGGLRIECSRMIHPGTAGIIQLERSDGQRNLVGVRICHCRYIGAMRHQCGIQFIPLPAQFEGKSIAA